MKRPSLNRNQIKYLVIVAMVIDHLAWAFVPTESLLGQLMHVIGRLTGPTMAYFVVEGYVHTRNVKRYASRLAIFALISWPAFTLFEFGKLPVEILQGRLAVSPVQALFRYGILPIERGDGSILTFYLYFGVIYTLLLSLLAVWLWDKWKCSRGLKFAAVIVLCVLSHWGDWPTFDILFALCFFAYRDNKKSMWTLYAIISVLHVLYAMSTTVNPWPQLCQLGVLLVMPLLGLCYNGESGSRKGIHKWFFYVFYPAHLLLLALIKTVV